MLLIKDNCTTEERVETQMVVEQLGKFTRSFGLSFAVTSIFSALLVVVKETNPALLALMKAATGHHWMTHGLADLVVFIIVGWLLARPNCGEGVRISTRSLVAWIIASLAVSWAIIVGFYLI